MITKAQEQKMIEAHKAGIALARDMKASGVTATRVTDKYLDEDVRGAFFAGFVMERKRQRRDSKGMQSLWGIEADGTPARFGSFRTYATREEAEKIAAQFRADWPHHTYKVVRVL